MPKWSLLGSGTYNTVYRSDDGLKVLKIQIAQTFGDKPDLDSPRRSIRLWNELNSELEPPAYVTQTEHGIGWVCPFVEGDQASDEEISAALIKIFNTSGRIIVDATAPRNFVKTPAGQIVCVDIGKALQMDRREEAYFVQNKRRRKSITSLDEVIQNRWESITWFFKVNRVSYPNTIDTIKALIFIKSNRPDIFDVSFLKREQALVTQLAQAYDRQEVPKALAHIDRISAEQLKANAEPEEVRSARGILSGERPITFDNIKESCVKQLENYINIRGTINRYGLFVPSVITKIFRDKALSKHKVLNAQSVIKLINKAGSLNDIQMALEEAQGDITLSKSKFTSGMAICLEKCKLIVTLANQGLDKAVTSGISPNDHV